MLNLKWASLVLAVGVVLSMAQASPRTGNILPRGCTNGQGVTWTSVTGQWDCTTPGNTAAYMPLAGGTFGGAVIFSGDNAYDIGASGATRPRTLYLGTSIKVPAITLGQVLVSATAPTIASAGCTSPAVTWSNGTAAFKLTIGTNCTGVKTIVLTLPAATNGWVCRAQDNTTPASFVIAAENTSATAVTLRNYARTTGLAIDWVASEVLHVSCLAG